MKKGTFALPVKVVISGGLLYFLFRGMDIQAFWSSVSSISLIEIVLVFLAILLIQVLSAFRWRTIVIKKINISFQRILSIYFIGMFFNNFLPTLVGGDIVKGYYLYRDSGRGGISLASIFIDRYTGFTALMFITALSAILGHKAISGTSVLPIVIALLTVFILLSLILWIEPLHRWAVDMLNRIRLFGINERLDSFYRALMNYKDSVGVILKAFLISLLVQVGNITCYYILSRGLNIDVSFTYLCIAVPLANVFAMLPFSLSGLGIREGAFVFLLGRIGVEPAMALSLSLIFFSLGVFASFIGGIEYVRVGGVNIREIEDVKAIED